MFGLDDAQNSEYNVGCFRIPAVVQTSDGVLLAFAEGRIDSCHDCEKLGIAMKRSLDGGNSWSNLSWPVPPTPVMKVKKWKPIKSIFLDRRRLCNGCWRKPNGRLRFHQKTGYSSFQSRNE